MFKTRAFLISALSLLAMMTRADSMKKIDVLNDCAQSMHLAVQDADRNFNVDFKVPAYAKALVIAKITELNTLQEQLFLGVVRNSAEEITRAIAAGANVNQAKEGKTPLAWALSLGNSNAVVCLHMALLDKAIFLFLLS